MRVVLLLIVLAVAGRAEAASWSKSPLPADRSRTKGVVHPLSAQSITQNLDPNTIVSGLGLACVGTATTDTGLWRLYDLDADHGLVGQFCVESVDYAIETAVGPQNVTVNVFCLDDGLPFLNAFLVLAGTAVQPQPEADLAFFNIEVGGCCDSATQRMAVELLSDDCLESGTCQFLFFGANDLGQTGPSYVSAEDCGVPDPVDTMLIAAVDYMLIQVINGSDEAQGGDGGGVPATGGPGAIVLVLALLGASALLLRQRSSPI